MKRKKEKKNCLQANQSTEERINDFGKRVTKLLKSKFKERKNKNKSIPEIWNIIKWCNQCEIEIL